MSYRVRDLVHSWHGDPKPLGGLPPKRYPVEGILDVVQEELLDRHPEWAEAIRRTWATRRRCLDCGETILETGGLGRKPIRCPPCGHERRQRAEQDRARRRARAA